MAKKAKPTFFDDWTRIVTNVSETLLQAINERDASTIGGVIADAMRHEKDLEVIAGKTRSREKLDAIVIFSRNLILIITTARQTLGEMVKNCS
jgi:hypothetical protein